MSSRARVRQPLSAKPGKAAAKARGSSHAKAPSPEEWERIKPVVKRHYIDEGKTLLQLLALLSKEHDFKATPPMMKERLKRWKLPKNFKKADLQGHAEVIKLCDELGLDTPQDILTDGRHYPLDRVARHFGSDPRYRCSLLQSDSGSKATISRFLLQTSSADYRIESLLTAASRYWSDALARSETPTSVRARRKADRVRSDPKDMTVDIFGALQLLSQGDETRGFRGLNKTCGRLMMVFTREEPDLLGAIVSIFTSNAWIRHLAEFSKITRFAYYQCHKTGLLGPYHPLSIIFSSLASLANSMETFQDVRERVFQMMMDLAKTAGDSVKLDREYIHAVEMECVSNITSRLAWHEAKKLIQGQFSHYRRTLGPRNSHTLRLQSDLASLYTEEANHARDRRETTQAQMCGVEAEQIYAKLVDMGKGNPLDYHRNGLYINAAERLGQLHFGRQEFQKAHDYYYIALTWAVEKFGGKISYVLRLSKHLKALQRMSELGLVDLRRDMGEDCNVLSTGPAQERLAQVSEMYDAHSFESCEEIDDAILHVPEVYDVSRQTDPSNSEILLHHSPPFYKPRNEEANTIHIETPCAGFSGVPEDVRDTSMLDDFVAAPTDDIPDFFPRRLFEEDPHLDEVGQLFEGHRALQALVEDVDF